MRATANWFLIAAVLFAPVGKPASAAAAAPAWRSANIWPTSSTQYAEPAFNRALADLQGLNANAVTLIVPYEQADLRASTMYRRSDTPTDAALATGIRAAHAAGLQVNVKLMLDPAQAGVWRATIEPDDRAAWYRNYGDLLARYAVIAQDEGAEMFTLGSELHGVASAAWNLGNTQPWYTLIARVRALYSGHVTYSTNQSFEAGNIRFWDALDLIGIDAYYELPRDQEPTLENMKANWAKWDAAIITPTASRYGKPVIFQEVGYGSHVGTAYLPFDSLPNEPEDQALQARAYRAMFEYWADKPVLNGINLWEWCLEPSRCSPLTNGFGIMGKQAEETVRSGFSGLSAAPAEPAVSARWSDGTIAVRVGNGGGLPLRGIVDVEVYDAAGARVLQRFYESQRISGGTAGTYAVPFAPGTSGPYRVAVGLFAPGWSANYLWDGSAATVVKPAGPPPDSAAIDLWWPGEDAGVRGVQPFKGIVSGWDASAYRMTWSVDGGRENELAYSGEGYPHKESSVDLSGWDWRADGRYRLRFTAYNAAGKEIAGKNAVIHVLR